MAEETAAPIEMPPSEAWSPDQALAAAQRVGYVELVVIGWDAEGNVIVRHSRSTPPHLLWLAEELRGLALGS